MPSELAVRQATKPALTGLIVALTFGLTLSAMLIPDLAADATMNGMTHYMGLIMMNSPWNLLAFMAAPALLLEGIAVCGLIRSFRGRGAVAAGRIGRAAALLVGPVMVAAATHLLLRLIPRVTAAGVWRGAADVISISLFFASVVPMVVITLLQLGLLGGTDARAARRRHAVWMTAAMVLTHLTMIVGMLDPAVLGWVGPAHVHR